MEDRTNVLLLMPDQHRHDWVGYAGSDWCRTPNLDRLAAAGRGPLAGPGGRPAVVGVRLVSSPCDSGAIGDARRSITVRLVSR